jgi:hypothetical protein
MLALLLAPFACAARSQPDTTTQALAPGITLTQEITAGDTPLIVNILRVDLKAPGVKVRCGQARDAITLEGPTRGREPVHSLAARQGALAAVNADFFPFTAGPVSLAIRDGELLREPLAYRACLGIGANGVVMDVLTPIGTLTPATGAPVPLDGINRYPHDGETVALTPSYAASNRLDKPATVVTLSGVGLPVRVSQDMHGTVEAVASLAVNEPLPLCPAGSVLLVASGQAAGGLAAQCKGGDMLTFRFDLTSNAPPPQRGRYPSRAGLLRGRMFTPSWTDVQQAVGGGPWLVRGGQVAVDGEAEDFPAESFVNSRHARTAAGVTSDGTLLLVTVDGGQAWSRGVSLPDLALLMQRLGAVNAINLDGGGSSTMAVGGGVVNAPSDGRERPIADALLVYGDTPDPPGAADLRIQPGAPDGVSLPVGGSIRFNVVDADGKPLPPTQPVLWGTGDGLGFISQRGVFTSFHAGAGTVVARVGTQQISVPVRVLSGTAALLKARFSNVANNPPDRNLLTVTVLDRFGNPVVGQRVGVQVHGGEVESPLITDDKGQASSEIVWEAPPGQRVLTVSAGSATPLTLRK